MRAFAADFDLARLQRFGYFSLQLDRKQTILQRSVRGLHVVGEFEAPFGLPLCNALVQMDAILPAVLLGTGDDEQVGSVRQRQLVTVEAGDGHYDAVTVLALLDDVIGRPVVRR